MTRRLSTARRNVLARARRRANRAEAIRHRWDVTFSATRPERPGLRTQAEATVAASSREDAINIGRNALVQSGWEPIALMSAVKKYRIRP